MSARAVLPNLFDLIAHVENDIVQPDEKISISFTAHQ